jgi:predicted MFS family arabinose efflux permease
MVPAARRGIGYGTFTAAYGLAWLAGGTILGALYDHAIHDLIIFTVITQALALLLFVPLLHHRRSE